MIFRREVGWCVAQAFRLTGARWRILRLLREGDCFLPIVFHAAESVEVREILSWLNRKGVLDRVRLTFDDGWRQFLGTIPVLEEFNRKATLFIAPGEVARGVVWTHGLTVPERQALYGLALSEREARLLEWGPKTHAEGSPLLMTEAEIREVARHPLVEIGNHTWSHLSCTDRPQAEVLAEVCKAQTCLTEWCGKRPREFAYPFGRGTPELDAAIRALGLRPHYTRQGFVYRETIGAARNMAYEGMTMAENIGRILTAWPKVGETR